MHGGQSSGAPIGNLNAQKHGQRSAHSKAVRFFTAFHVRLMNRFHNVAPGNRPHYPRLAGAFSQADIREIEKLFGAFAPDYVDLVMEVFRDGVAEAAPAE